MSLFNDDPFDDEEVHDGIVLLPRSGTDQTRSPSLPADLPLESQVTDIMNGEDENPRKRPRDESDVGMVVEETAPVETAIEVPNREGDVVEGLAGSDAEAPSMNEADQTEELSTSASPEVNEELQQQLSASSKKHTEATLPALTARCAELQHQLHTSKNNAESMSSQWTAERKKMLAEVDLANILAVEATATATATTITVPNMEEASAASMDDVKLALLAAEREQRQRLSAEAQVMSMDAHAAWLQRVASVWHRSFEEAQKRGVASKAALSLPPLELEDETTNVLSLSKDVCVTIQERLKAASDVFEALHLKNESTIMAEKDNAELATSDASVVETTVAVSSRISFQDIALLLRVVADHLCVFSEEHDSLVQFAVSQRGALSRCKRAMQEAGIYDLEPRVALLREVAERCVKAVTPTPAEQATLSQMKSLQERVALLEAVLAAHVLKGDVPTVGAQSVVPQVLKERISRCEALESQMVKLQAENLALHRVLVSEGNPSKISIETHVENGVTTREVMLEHLANQWHRRMSSVLKVVAMSSNPSAAMCEALRCQAAQSASTAIAQGQFALTMIRHSAVLSQRVSDGEFLLNVMLGVVTSLVSLMTERNEDAVTGVNDLQKALNEALARVCNTGAGNDEEAPSEPQPDMLRELAEYQESLLQRLNQEWQQRHKQLESLFESKEAQHLRTISLLGASLQAADRALCEALGVPQSLNGDDTQVATAFQSLAVNEVLERTSSEGLKSSTATTSWSAEATTQMKTALLEQARSQQSKLEAVTGAFRNETQQLRQRIDWLLSQDGNKVYADLEASKSEVEILKSQLRAAQEKGKQAASLQAESQKLKALLSERDARVTSLEGQLKVSQEGWSKARLELSTAQKLTSSREDMIKGLEATVAAQQQRLEAQTEQIRQLEEAAVAAAINNTSSADMASSDFNTSVAVNVVQSEEVENELDGDEFLPAVADTDAVLESETVMDDEEEAELDGTETADVVHSNNEDEESAFKIREGEAHHEEGASEQQQNPDSNEGGAHADAEQQEDAEVNEDEAHAEMMKADELPTAGVDVAEDLAAAEAMDSTD